MHLEKAQLKSFQKTLLHLALLEGHDFGRAVRGYFTVSFSPYGRPTLPIMTLCQNAKGTSDASADLGSDLAWVLCLALSQYSQEIFPHQHLAVVEEFDQLLNRSAGIGNCWDRNQRSLGWESGWHPGRCHCTAARD